MLKDQINSKSTLFELNNLFHVHKNVYYIILYLSFNLIGVSDLVFIYVHKYVNY